MSDWSTVFLGVIAVATSVMALLQVGAILYGLRLARRVEGVVNRVELETRPIVQRLTVVSEDAAKVSALAVGQAERMSALVDDVTRRLDDAVNTVQTAVGTPARQALALLSALRTVIETLRAARGRPRPGRRGFEEEDTLFIG